jgi:glutamate carboxypeptidase
MDPSTSGYGRLDAMRGQTGAMLDQLADLVSVETPSEDLDACAAGAAAVCRLATALLGDPGERREANGRYHLRWKWPVGQGTPGVVLIGHYDTVWPRGTLARWPFSADERTGTATGPGCFDMKAGIVQLFHAVASLDNRDGIEILLTSDEEIGSPTSRHLIEDASRQATAALILEPSAAGALKVARKGTGFYRLEVHGRAAHAGLEPENGANALIELSHLLLAASAMARPGSGTSVTATVAEAGTARNVVPALAYADLDVRAADPDEARRVDRELRALRTTVPGTTLTVTGGLNRPPLPRSSTTALYALAAALAADLGLGPLDGASVGGGSDGNFTAAAGCPTLDGLGAVGGNAHAEGEYVAIAAMPERAALLAGLLDHVRTGQARVPRPEP